MFYYQSADLYMKGIFLPLGYSCFWVNFVLYEESLGE